MYISYLIAAESKFLRVLLSFAVGGLLGDVFLHLLPEAWEGDNQSEFYLWDSLDDQNWMLLKILLLQITIVIHHCAPACGCSPAYSSLPLSRRSSQATQTPMSRIPNRNAWRLPTVCFGVMVASCQRARPWIAAVPATLRMWTKCVIFVSAKWRSRSQRSSPGKWPAIWIYWPIPLTISHTA